MTNIVKKDFPEFMGGSIGAFISWLVSAPGSSFKKKEPIEKIKNVEIAPNLEIKKGKKYYHIHHWMYLSILYFLLNASRWGIFKSKFLRGIVLGAIAQGLVYKDRLKVVEKDGFK